jgi:hypothetical protein
MAMKLLVIGGTRFLGRRPSALGLGAVGQARAGRQAVTALATSAYSSIWSKFMYL